MIDFPKRTYDVIYADPPWNYYGDPNKDAAAGKHYNLMTDDDILSLPVSSLCHSKSVLYLWATCPRLDFAIDAIRGWGLHFRGVAFVWAKTRKDGAIIGGQGPRPSFVKPIAEFVLIGSKAKKGRPLPLDDESIRQFVLEPRGRHSEKPVEVRKRIERLHGECSRIELFARKRFEGWDAWGNEV